MEASQKYRICKYKNTAITNINTIRKTKTNVERFHSHVFKRHRTVSDTKWLIVDTDICEVPVTFEHFFAFFQNLHGLETQQWRFLSAIWKQNDSFK